VELAQEILSKYPTIINAQDNEGKTPLHYAAICKDGGIVYDALVDYGADENKVDNVRIYKLLEIYMDVL
jgi:ankyrin repeat protein